jgi:Flp pilus assembly protein TadG
MVTRLGQRGRRGSILPLLAISILALLGFVALAVDLGLMMVARTQCQDAADSAAMAGTRTLNGDVSNNNNYAAAGPAAVTAATSNSILARPIQPSQVQTTIGKYSYSGSQQTFVAYPLDAGSTNNPNDNWSLVSVTINYTDPTAFAGVFGVNAFSGSCTATAVHRPRDVALVLDYSGSMRFASLLGIPYSGARSTNNPEGVFPVFGPYSDQTTAALQQTNSQTIIGTNTFDASNITESDSLNDNRPTVVGDFYQQLGVSPVQAFTAAPAGYATTPAGDNFLKTTNNTGAAYAKSLKDVTGSTSRNASFETNGYPQYTSNPFQGYTGGPSYWGKTFFVWPPDPRAAYDWRKLFFFKSDGVTPVDDNTLLWSAAGVWKTPTSYKINYQAILKWIQTTGTNPFPPQMHAGRIDYYDAMPNSADNSLNQRFWTQFPLTDLNERFWKDYIDYVLGLWQSGSSSWQIITQNTGYGADFNWSDSATPTAVYAKPTSGSPPPYMDYRDNPQRPRLRCWFGPMTMADFLGCYNMWGSTSYQKFVWWPGTCHESPLYACKLGIQAALRDCQNNHPNDTVSMIMFSVPNNAAGLSSYGGRFNRVRAPLGRNYTRMIDSLWFPATTIDNPGTEIRPYDYANNIEVPRAMGGTCYAMGFMLAYNQFSGNSSLVTYNPAPAPSGDAGGLGRKGAQKVIILETDGAPNTTATANFTNAGPYASYYNVRTNSTTPSAGEFPSVAGYSDNDPTVTGQINTICQQIVAQDTANPPGYSTARKPVLIHTIAFGPVFDATSSGRTAALQTLQQIQYIGNTQASASDPLPAYKIITGTDATIVTNLRTALETIMQGEVPVSLIR